MNSQNFRDLRPYIAVGLVPRIVLKLAVIMQRRGNASLGCTFETNVFLADPRVDARTDVGCAFRLISIRCVFAAVPEVLTSVRKSLFDVALSAETFGVIGIPWPDASVGAFEFPPNKRPNGVVGRLIGKGRLVVSVQARGLSSGQWRFGSTESHENVCCLSLQPLHEQMRKMLCGRPCWSEEHIYNGTRAVGFGTVLPARGLA
jgi:hypothetical protein